MARLQSILAALGNDKSKLVIDLSCRRKDNTWYVAMNRWQTITEMEITQGMRPPTRLVRCFNPHVLRSRMFLLIHHRVD